MPNFPGHPPLDFAVMQHHLWYFICDPSHPHIYQNNMSRFDRDPEEDDNENDAASTPDSTHIPTTPHTIKEQ